MTQAVSSPATSSCVPAYHSSHRVYCSLHSHRSLIVVQHVLAELVAVREFSVTSEAGETEAVCS